MATEYLVYLGPGGKITPPPHTHTAVIEDNIRQHLWFGQVLDVMSRILSVTL